METGASWKHRNREKKQTSCNRRYFHIMVCLFLGKDTNDLGWKKRWSKQNKSGRYSNELKENIKFILVSLPGSRQFLRKPLSCLGELIDISLGFWYILRYFEIYDMFSLIVILLPACSCPHHPPHMWEPNQVWLLPVSVCGSWPAKVSHTLAKCYTKTKPRKSRQEACVHSSITAPL